MGNSIDKEKKKEVASMEQMKYKMLYLIFLIIDLCLLSTLGMTKIQKRLPQRLYLYQHAEETFDFSLPLQGKVEASQDTIQCTQANTQHANVHLNLQEPFSLYAQEKGSCMIQVKLLGIIPLKHIAVKVLDEKEVCLGGKTIGIRVDTNGVLVLGLGKIEDAQAYNQEPARNVIQPGDYIQSINGKTVYTKEELIGELAVLPSKKVVLKIKRGNTHLLVSLHAIRTKNNQWKLGIWVRDDTQGIGTLTFIKKNGQFVALGHGITDVDTGLQMEVKNGYICDVGIYHIQRGDVGKPGAIGGFLKKERANRLGTIRKNSRVGIIGTWKDTDQLENFLPIGLKQQIKIGKAKIICQLGKKSESYDVKIIKKNLGSKEKNLVIQVIDPKLLNKTGGIVQGMSGSPIIQDGKLIGAVTHVFVNNPQKGYGIFIESMLEETNF